MRQRKGSFSRRPPVQDPRPRVLIACEGIGTEPVYFDSIRSSKRLPKSIIALAAHRGTDPRSVVEAVIAERDALLNEHQWNKEFDSAWAVFDRDEHQPGRDKPWREALDLARDNEIEVAASNPCFELWLLLHFHSQTASLDAHAAQRALKGHYPDYEKSSRLYPDPFADLTAEATARADALDKRMRRDGTGPYANPSTGVWRLVESLLAIPEIP